MPCFESLRFKVEKFRLFEKLISDIELFEKRKLSMISEDLQKQIVDEYITVEKASSNTLSKKYKVSTGTVVSCLRKFGIEPYKHGNNSTRRKMNPEGKYALSKKRRDKLLNKNCTWHKRKKQKPKLLERFAYMCYICKQAVSFESSCVDHCHSNDEIRGILCRNCNLGLSYFNDSPELMKNAIDYIANPPMRKFVLKLNSRKNKPL